MCLIFTLIPSISYSLTEFKDYELTQVFILIRHNLRAPIIYADILNRATSKPWPIWQTEGDNLTTKGRQLEIYMGNYFRTWFDRMGLFRQDQCPDSNNVSVSVYANNLQCTIATAQSFITGAFPNCLVKAFYQSDLGTSKIDPTFHSVITDNSTEFKQQVITTMTEKLAQLDLT
ncbi:MAG: histidine-type phosphatase [Arsenophonus endosymbiont of Dermacentor nuttalli]